MILRRGRERKRDRVKETEIQTDRQQEGRRKCLLFAGSGSHVIEKVEHCIYSFIYLFIWIEYSIVV